jgi:hypothetical protein
LAAIYIIKLNVIPFNCLSNKLTISFIAKKQSESMLFYLLIAIQKFFEKNRMAIEVFQLDALLQLNKNPTTITTGSLGTCTITKKRPAKSRSFLYI